MKEKDFVLGELRDACQEKDAQIAALSRQKEELAKMGTH